MISTVLYDNDVDELEKIRLLLKDIAAYLSEEEWKINSFHLLEQIQEYVKDQYLIDMAVYDVTEQGALEYLPEFRRKYQESYLMLVADAETSPMDYLRPGIQADSLLIRPFYRQQAETIIGEFVHACLDFRTEKDTEQFYVIESKEGSINIPYSQIYFFEAREKKIYVCIGKEEFGFYCTIERLESELSGQFVRCHRGFIVNTAKIRKVMPSQNRIILTDGFEVPLSRSYKAAMKGLLK